MNICEFAETYCKDILAEAQRRSSVFDLSGFSYDEVITEEDGTQVCVINTPNYQIPLVDILSLGRPDFAAIWPYQECLEAFDAYVKTLIITEGEEALTQIRDALRSEMDKISRYSEILM